MTINQYLSNVNQLYKTGNAREHSYRGDLQNLLTSMLPDILVTNEPARIACGAPDYSLTRKGVPVGYIEAKDIGVDLKSKLLKEQFDRYKAGLSNLIITDYLEFQFYKDGDGRSTIAIANVVDGQIVPIPENFKTFTEHIIDFSTTISQSIKSPTKLAQMMAGKARLMADVIEKSLDSDDKLNQRSNIKMQMLSFQQMLIHDINNKAFSDIYAQTIAYGMFAARYHDPTLEDFSRTEAAQLIPKSNPFLRKLFQDIAGYDLDKRLVWIVDELVSIFLASDVSEIMKNFGKSTKQEDPVVHFYETFLGEYSPALRKARGVWYTPEPVVGFIVRSVDEILKTEFGLSQGLGDTSKTKIKKKVFTKATADARSKVKEVEIEEEVHRVQILDPATGTGTFLAEVVKQIYKKFKGQEGIWSNYVKKDLIPRLNGFELLMASYAMAHLKMDMLLTETGVELPDDQRLRIYLTNSLEKAHPDTGTLFSSWLSDEADQANAIKRDNPVMVIIGNPPYSGISSNNGEWISNLIEDYKYVDGVHFKERKHWLNDDYVKFIRFGQYFIEKNGEGVLAFINPHGFLDNPTFRGMRWSLLKSFDKIFTLDLHGNSNKKETAPDGGEDSNVFDILQGVSINILVKTGEKDKLDLGKVFHQEIFGKRDLKYEFLGRNSYKSLKYNSLTPSEPYYFFVPRNQKGRDEYLKGFKVNEIFPLNTSGMVTANDSLSIFISKGDLEKVTNEILTSDDPYTKFDIRDTRRVNKERRLEELEGAIKNGPVKVNYKPFDIRYMYYTEKNEHWINSPRKEVMQHFMGKENLGLVVSRQCNGDWRYIFSTKEINVFNLTGTAGRLGSGYTMPLYIYPENVNQSALHYKMLRKPNLKPEFIEKLSENLNLRFTAEKENGEKTYSPIDVYDYIYGVFHSPTYRKIYSEFLKVDFPRVPLPADHVAFWKLVKLGGDLRQIHLLEHPSVEDYITQYPIDGDNVVTRKMTKSSIGYEPITSTHGKVWINDEQYFDNVPLVAWEFYIGGYQPAQKWLKDRKGRELNFEDILHYQKMIVALTETNRLMDEIDKIEII